MKCPQCGSSVERHPGENFCPECGAEIIVAAPFAGYDFSSVFAQIKTAGSEKSFSELSAKSKDLADRIESEDFDPTAGGGCPHLTVEYNKNLFFLSGSESVMRLRMTPQSSRLRHVLLFMETQRNGERLRRQISVSEVLQNGRAFELHVPFRPEEMSGSLSFVFYLGCQTDGALDYWQFMVSHKVYDKNQSGSSLARQVVINAPTTITASQAAEVTYRNSLSDAIHGLGVDPSVHELIDRLNELPPVFERKVLAATTWRPEDVLVKGMAKPLDRLILEWNGCSLLVLGKACVKFGRDPEQVDLLVRSGRGKLGPRDYPNSTVSRLHAEILQCEDTVKLFDRSSYGTYINGRKPDNSGIPIPDRAQVEFGDIHWNMQMQRCEVRSSRNICQTCSANKIKSLTFTRTDGEKEFYLMVWQCCELGLVVEELADWNLFFRNGTFFIRTPDQEFFYLRPGHVIESNGQKITVKYFQQN